jgi:hypothetical protein
MAAQQAPFTTRHRDQPASTCRPRLGTRSPSWACRSRTRRRCASSGSAEEEEGGRGGRRREALMQELDNAVKQKYKPGVGVQAWSRAGHCGSCQLKNRPPLPLPNNTPRHTRTHLRDEPQGSVRPDEDSDGADAPSWSGRSGFVDSNVSSHEDGVAAVPLRGFDPCRRVEHRGSAAVTRVDVRRPCRDERVGGSSSMQELAV